VVALFVKNRPYAQSSFLQQFDERALLEAVCRDNGVTLDIRGTGRGSGTVFGGGYEQTASMDLRQPPIDVFRSKVMPALHARIERRLLDEGCEIEGRSKGGTSNFAQLEEFSFRYRQGIVRGVLRVYSLPSSDDHLRLVMLLDEH
jgi:hypothetical protein